MIAADRPIRAGQPAAPSAAPGARAGARAAAIRADLRARLTARGLCPAGARWRALSGGRSNLLWRVGDGRQDLIVKLYDTQAASPLFANDPAAERLALEIMAPRGLAPHPLAGFDSDAGPCLVYRAVPGRVWRHGAAAVARLLARVHATPPDARLPRLQGGPQALAAQATAMLCDLPPQADSTLAAPAAALRDRVERALATALRAPALPAPWQPVHGDPVPGNIICAPSGPVLIDWQCPGLGDACADIATFLSPAMQLLYRGRPLTAGERRAFLAAYPDRITLARYAHLGDLLHLRIAAHCLWKAARGDDAYRAALAAESAAMPQP